MKKLSIDNLMDETRTLDLNIEMNQRSQHLLALSAHQKLNASKTINELFIQKFSTNRTMWGGILDGKFPSNGFRDMFFKAF